MLEFTFFFSRVKNSSAITCLKSRDYSSLGPVRYIPKKSSKSNKTEDSEPIKVSKKKEFREFSEARALENEVSHGGNGVQESFNFNSKPRHGHQKLYFDLLSNGAEQDIMEEPKEAAEELYFHQEKSCEEVVVEPQNDKTKHDAENLVVKLLATRAFTAVELRKKLCGKRFSPDVVEEVINDFKCRGFINDSLYAEAFSQSRWSSLSWGPQRIKQALFRKGVSKHDTEKAIQLVFEGGDSDGYQESSHGLSKLSMDRLFVQASKQWLRSRDVPKETRKTRIIRWLQYRGFGWDVISSIVKKLESIDPP
ncbi:Regulatory protein [Trema orientale]|uniref:Regulatory protein RecX n=1 Tax=Trema orientale TaxID=63057 RepID=A0A2P5CGQ8_TREOI|nr:Regulatory protein [Trema orientale]